MRIVTPIDGVKVYVRARVCVCVENKSVYSEFSLVVQVLISILVGVGRPSCPLFFLLPQGTS